jgi:hypothetical protein
VGEGSKRRGIAAKERSSCGGHCSGPDGGDGVSLNRYSVRSTLMEIYTTF